MNKYGYITDQSYNTQEGDVVWNFDRYNQDQTVTSYVGIETTRNITSEKVTIIGTAEEFREWLNRYNPDPLGEI